MHLEGAITARSHGHAEEALTHALAQWHRTKHPVIAQAIDVFSAEALEQFSAPKTKDKAGFHQAWLEVARERDGVATGWLAQTLMQRLPVNAEQRVRAYLERLDALTHHVADPRVASALCSLLEEPELMIFDLEHTRPLYAPVASLLVAQGDVRTIERLLALQRSPRAKNPTLREVVAELIAPLIAGLERVEVQPLEHEAEWRRLLPVEGPSSPTAGEEVLLEAVYANAKDEVVRSVYADALLDRGDAHGEFISAQLGQQTKRANALLRKHRDAWLGPLAVVLKHLEFERGFLTRAELTQSSVATEEVWAAAAVDQRLGTVESLRQGRGNTKHYTAFLSSGALRNLRRIELPTYQLLPLLGKPPFSKSVEHVVLPNRGSLQHLEKLGALPMESLTTLTTPLEVNESGQWLQYLISGKLIHRVRHYRVSSGWGVSQPLVGEVFARWQALDPLSLAVHTVADGPRQLMLKRVGSAVHLIVHAAFEREAFKVIASFVGPLSEVHVFDNAAWPVKDEAGLRRVAEARGATLHVHVSEAP